MGKTVCLPSHWRMASARMNSLAWASQRPMSSSVTFQSAVIAFLSEAGLGWSLYKAAEHLPGSFSQDRPSSLFVHGVCSVVGWAVFLVPSSVLPPCI